MEKKIVKILFTCIGRRVELVQAFKKASSELGVKLIVYGADCVDTAPTLSFCDQQRIVCGITEKGYIPSLLDICRIEEIDAVIPTIDTDLLLLSKNKGMFAEIGTRVIVSEDSVIRICRDKMNTSLFFGKLGLSYPAAYDDYSLYDMEYPAFIKPKDGSSSINAYKVKNYDDLQNIANKISNYIVMPYIDGEEYTVDVFCDFSGNPIFITPRIRLAVRAGEVLKTQIDMDDIIIEESKKIIDALKPCGPITIQLIRQKNTQKDYYIEINPRFGGGAPLSMKAGADSARALLQLLLGVKADNSFASILNGAVYCRFDQSVRVR